MGGEQGTTGGVNRSAAIRIYAMTVQTASTLALPTSSSAAVYYRNAVETG